jgi:predicted PurR-regulated permease PerM
MFGDRSQMHVIVMIHPIGLGLLFGVMGLLMAAVLMVMVQALYIEDVLGDRNRD